MSIVALNVEVSDNFVSTAALEMEVEIARLRLKEGLLRSEAIRFLEVVSRCTNADGMCIDEKCSHVVLKEASKYFGEILIHLMDEAKKDSSRDEVTSIQLRSLIEQVFSIQRMVNHATHTVMHISLASETIVWFPARMRHILHYLFGNALSLADRNKGEMRVTIAIGAANGHFVIRMTDNRVGFTSDEGGTFLVVNSPGKQLQNTDSQRCLAVVQYLVGQCCGTVELQSDKGNGTSVLVLLPRYDVGDYIESNHD